MEDACLCRRGPSQRRRRSAGLGRHLLRQIDDIHHCPVWRSECKLLKKIWQELQSSLFNVVAFFLNTVVHLRNNEWIKKLDNDRWFLNCDLFHCNQAQETRIITVILTLYNITITQWGQDTHIREHESKLTVEAAAFLREGYQPGVGVWWRNEHEDTWVEAVGPADVRSRR